MQTQSGGSGRIVDNDRKPPMNRLRAVLPPLLVAAVAVGELCLFALYATEYDVASFGIG